MQYHHITIQTHSQEKPKFFIGSTLRGTFGPLLKKHSCINPSYKCEGCFAQSQSTNEKPFLKRVKHTIRYHIPQAINRLNTNLTMRSKPLDLATDKRKKLF